MKRYHRVFARTHDPKTNWYAFNGSLHGYQPNRNQQQNIAFKKLAGEVNSSSKMFTATMEISHHSIGSILVQDEEVTLLQSRRLEF